MYNEETQDYAVRLMIEAGFVQGRMLPNINEEFTIPNALVETVEDGPIWYGDLEWSDVGKLSQVATKLDRVLLIQSQTRFDANSTMRVGPTK